MIEVLERPLVTFILLAYNQERYIGHAIEGALQQTYSPLEIIVSDDASDDQTFANIRSVAANYSGPHSLVVIRQEKNRGIADHYSRICSIAHGDWLFSAAGDDISLPHRVADCMEMVLHQRNVAAVFSDFEEYGELANCFPRHPWPAEEDYLPENQIIGCGVRVPGATLAIDARVMRIFGPINGDIQSEDRVLPFRAVFLGGIKHIPKALVLRGRHEGGINARARDLKNGFSWQRRMSARKEHFECCARLNQYLKDIDRAKQEQLISEDRAQKLTHLAKCRLHLRQALVACHSDSYWQRFFGALRLFFSRGEGSLANRKKIGYFVKALKADFPKIK